MNVFRGRTADRAALTLVEMLVCSSLLVIVLAAVNSGLFSGRKAAAKGIKYLDRLGQINRLLEHCKRAVRFATSITTSPWQGGGTVYKIEYIEKLSPDDLGRMTATMSILARPVRGGTMVTVKSGGRKTRYHLEDLNFSFVLDRNLVTITLTPFSGGRQPIALSLFAPFLTGPAATTVLAGAPAPGSAAVPGGGALSGGSLAGAVSPAASSGTGSPPGAGAPSSGAAPGGTVSSLDAQSAPGHGGSPSGAGHTGTGTTVQSFGAGAPGTAGPAGAGPVFSGLPGSVPAAGDRQRGGLSDGGKDDSDRETAGDTGGSAQGVRTLTALNAPSSGVSVHTGGVRANPAGTADRDRVSGTPRNGAASSAGGGGEILTLGGWRGFRPGDGQALSANTDGERAPETRPDRSGAGAPGGLRPSGAGGSRATGDRNIAGHDRDGRRGSAAGASASGGRPRGSVVSATGGVEQPGVVPEGLEAAPSEAPSGLDGNGRWNGDLDSIFGR